ncbi:MAG: tRNA (adenosine(37)-N6)-threonylcarbamoyltransferase complex ATPase subunit type 1 TsaE [Acidimicrobiales bacterium]
MMPDLVVTSSPEETRQAGARLAGELEAGDVVLLVGELGAGKTTFVKGVADGLEVSDDVTSPTFTLCQIYHGHLRVVHADLWRLERVAEVVDLALDEGLRDDGVLLVEWGEAAEELFGKEALVVTFETGQSEGQRELRFDPRGDRWRARVGPGAA